MLKIIPEVIFFFLLCFVLTIAFYLQVKMKQHILGCIIFGDALISQPDQNRPIFPWLTMIGS